MSFPSNQKIQEILAKNMRFEETMREVFEAFPIHRALSMSLDKVSPAECRFSVIFYSPLTNIYGTVQGGVLGVILDAAIWMACASATDRDILEKNFMVSDSPPSGKIRVAAHTEKRYLVVAKSSGITSDRLGRCIISGHGQILTEDGTEVAIAASTKIFVPCG